MTESTILSCSGNLWRIYNPSTNIFIFYSLNYYTFSLVFMENILLQWQKCTRFSKVFFLCCKKEVFAVSQFLLAIWPVNDASIKNRCSKSMCSFLWIWQLALFCGRCIRYCHINDRN